MIGIGCTCGKTLRGTTNSPMYESIDPLEGDCLCGDEKPLFFNCDNCQKSYDFYGCMF